MKLIFCSAIDKILQKIKICINIKLVAGVRVDENAIYNHFAWVPAYNNEESIDWLFSQRNNKAQFQNNQNKGE